MFKSLLIFFILPLSSFAHYHKGEHIHSGRKIIWLDQYQSTKTNVTQTQDHTAQHGFILSNNDSLGSHLVASGHHSRQVEISGELIISDIDANEFYKHRKSLNFNNQVYFLFQAQQLDLINFKAEDVLTGHIVESNIGKYEPKNIIVKQAQFKIKNILLNIENPFFKNE